MNSGILLNGGKSPQYPFGLEPLIEFHSVSFNSITALGSEEVTEVSQLRGQASMMPSWASCWLSNEEAPFLLMWLLYNRNS